VAIDAEPYLDLIFGVADIYHEELQFPDRNWLENRLRRIGERWGLRWAEEFDAWETGTGLVTALLPADPAGLGPHPERSEQQSAGSN
jgi:hypothetical protein